MFRSQQAEVSLRIHSDQETIKFHAQESVLKKRISELEREAETAKLTLQQQLDNLSETIREEKETRKRMEQWFQRRLDTLDYYAQDVKLNPLDEKKIDHLISKINRLKGKKPWNENKNNLILDDAVLNPKNEEMKSSGTCTPFSHYACFFSSAASEENTINQAFIESQDRSLSDSRDILLDTSESMMSTDRPRKDAVDSFTKKMFDNKLTLTEKEKLFCAVLENNLAHEDLLHVNLEDILNVPNQEEKEKGPDDQPSISLGSLKFDIKEEGAIGNGCRRFDNTIRFGDLKDMELENAVSSIHMEEDSQQKISNLLESKMLLNSNWDQNIFSKASLSRIEMDKEKNSELDKPILSGFSISEIHNQESQRKTERGILGLLEDNGANNISLSNISRKMDDNIMNDKANKSNSSFLRDEDMRNLLNKATSELDLSTSSHNVGKDDGFKINISISELVKQLNTEFISDKILDRSFDNKSIHSHSHIRDPEVKQTELKVSKFAISDNKEDQETEFILEEIHDNNNVEREKKEHVPEAEKTPTPTLTTTETDHKNKPQQFKKINYPKPRPPAGPRKSMDFRLPANFLDEENTGHMSFENTPQHVASKTSSPQLNYSMYNIAETTSFDVDVSSQNIKPQGNNYNPEVMKMKIEYKNKRTVRSQTPAVRPKLVLNTKFQKNEHTEEEEETPKRGDEPSANYHRSFSLQANQHYNYKTVQPHSSYISSQHMFFNGLGSSPGGPNDQEKFYRRMSTKDQAKLKNILPYEKSKQYPAPDKEQGPEFCRKVPAEKASSAKFASKIYYEMDGSPKKPISPLKKSRLSMEANNEGALQFRAKKFANKKGDHTPQ